jgi:hypothetical protein
MKKISDEDLNELKEASFSLLQLVYNLPDDSGRAKRLKKILDKIKKAEANT